MSVQLALVSQNANEKRQGSKVHLLKTAEKRAALIVLKVDL